MRLNPTVNEAPRESQLEKYMAIFLISYIPPKPDVPEDQEAEMIVDKFLQFQRANIITLKEQGNHSLAESFGMLTPLNLAYFADQQYWQIVNQYGTREDSDAAAKISHRHRMQQVTQKAYGVYLGRQRNAR